MTNWRKTVNIARKLNDDAPTSDPDLWVKETMRNVRNILAEHVEFAGCIPALDAAIARDSVPEFDAALDQVYDVADREKIWMGL